jgi:ribose-phosphate pyrophosphokinase
MADMSKYMATIIDYFNHDAAISGIKIQTQKIREILTAYNARERKSLETAGNAESK